MNLRTIMLLGALTICGSTAAHAGDTYNTVPAGDRQYVQCLAYSAKQYEGGDAPSPIKGQSKAEAWCTCMWNETPDNFRGNLAKFSETARGAAMNKTCERYADWG